MAEYYVVTEDGDSMHVTASNTEDAVNLAVLEWGFEADPGYGFKVFAAEDALDYEFALHVVASADPSSRNPKGTESP